MYRIMFRGTYNECPVVFEDHVPSDKVFVRTVELQFTQFGTTQITGLGYYFEPLVA